MSMLPSEISRLRHDKPEKIDYARPHQPEEQRRKQQHDNLRRPCRLFWTIVFAYWFH